MPCFAPALTFPPFVPVHRNPHLLTLAGNFWARPKPLGADGFSDHWVEVEQGTQVVVHRLSPASPRGEVVLVHGLEGSSDSGYVQSMTWAAVTQGYRVHQFNMRGCGASDPHCASMYHAGLTSDLREVLRHVSEVASGPVFLVGYSLGGNQVLKLAGEGMPEGLAGVCAASVPIDLADSVRQIQSPQNRLYERRFLARLKRRFEDGRRPLPPGVSFAQVRRASSIWEFDDLVTARLFGFGTAERYYETQSAAGFLASISVPTLIVQAKDDPMIPFAAFRHPAFRTNSCLRLLAVEHGGHLGFIARGRPRFWLDAVMLQWVEALCNDGQGGGVG